MQRREDWAALVEACYDVEASDDEYTRRLSVAGMGCFVQAASAAAHFYDASDPSHFTWSSYHASDGASFQSQSNWELGVRAFDADYVQASYRSVRTAWLRRDTPAHLPIAQTFAGILDSFGVKDALAINGLNPAGTGTYLGLTFTRTPPRRSSGIARSIAAHLATGYRIRAKLQGAPKTLIDRAVAVVEESGRIEHAEGDAQLKPHREALAEAATTISSLRSSRSRRREPDALQEWRGLVAARWSLVDHFETGSKRYLVAVENAPGRPASATSAEMAALSYREAQVVTLRRMGLSQKEIAYDLGLALGTVSALTHRARKKLGG